MESATSFYAEDLAWIHDAGFTGFVTDAMPFLLRVLRERGIAGGPVVDLGCGSGVWVARLADEGYEPTGIDTSAAMLALARERVPGAAFLRGSFHDVELPRCRAVTAVGECFNYAGHGESAEESLPRLLERIHAALEPGGVLVFDVALPGRAGDEPRRVGVEGDGWAVLVHEIEEEGRLERRITGFRRVGGLYRRSLEVHRLRVWPADELARVLDAAGFEAERLASYGTRSFPRGYTAFVAAKRG